MRRLLLFLLRPIAWVHAVYRQQMRGVRRVRFAELVRAWMRLSQAERYGVNARGEPEVLAAYRRHLRNVRKRERRAS